MDLPISTPILVLAKSSGWTNNAVLLPARPPHITLKNNICFFVLYSVLYFNIRPYKSLNEKLSAWVGKYLITFTPLPLHRDIIPSCMIHSDKQ